MAQKFPEPPEYDLNGNLTAYDNETFTYDSENRLIAYARTGANPTSVSYDYDALGRRIKKIVDPGGANLVTQYLYDGDQVIAEYDGAGTLQRRYLDETPMAPPLFGEIQDFGIGAILGLDVQSCN